MPPSMRQEENVTSFQDGSSPLGREYNSMEIVRIKLVPAAAHNSDGGRR